MMTESMTLTNNKKTSSNAHKLRRNKWNILYSWNLKIYFLNKFKIKNDMN